MKQNGRELIGGSDRQEDVHGSAKKRPPRVASQKEVLVCSLLIVCTLVLVAHLPVLKARALSFDDSQYLNDNVLVRNPGWASTYRFLTEVLEPSSVRGYYQPLTMISLMLDYAFGGRPDNLWPFHLTNLALHAANTALVIVLLYLLFDHPWMAAGIGLLFGLHPMSVEPIAWVCERKTLLAAFFALWSLILFVLFAYKGGWKLSFGCFIMYLLALMSKPTSLPLPLVMLIMDYWPLNRLKRQAILEKLPLFALGGIFVIITYVSQARTASVSLPSEYGTERIPLIICHNIIFYLRKIIWPADLSCFYGYPEPLALSHPMVLTGVTGTCALIPVLLISLRWTKSIVIGWLIFFVAHHNLASTLYSLDSFDEAISHYKLALRLRPDFAQALHKLGIVLAETGRPNDAVVYLRQAVRLHSESPVFLTDLAWILSTHSDRKVRDADEALVIAKRAAELTGRKDSNSLDALAAAYPAKGQFDMALTTAQEAYTYAHPEELLKYEIRKRVELYRRGKAYIEVPTK